MTPATKVAINIHSQCHLESQFVARYAPQQSHFLQPAVGSYEPPTDDTTAAAQILQSIYYKDISTKAYDSEGTTSETSETCPSSSSTIDKREADGDDNPEEVQSPRGTASREPRIRLSDTRAVKTVIDKAMIDAAVPRLYNEYMNTSGGDLMKAAGLWFKREVWKRRLPWAELEKGKAYLRGMKKRRLDPAGLRRQIKEEHEEQDEAEQRKQGKRAHIKAMWRGYAARRRLRRLGTALKAALAEAEPKASAGESINHVSEARQPAPSAMLQEEPPRAPTKAPEDPMLPSAASAEGVACSDAIQDFERVLTPAGRAGAPLPPCAQRDSPPEVPRGKKHKTRTKDLESNLGKKWEPHVTADGHRPCARFLPGDGPR
ncbi:hypothetical protein SAMD00023353_1302390 [Rosellinia necatrix]|uniref:Uncharacterized protein n=1 Tax=Rosellinia necatrix TaxID=77044 RepID=A0A1W2TC47_ROSNE|nr:hypothetical protein SAMD00023353_1302390 [Rosellinia necatrix]